MPRQEFWFRFALPEDTGLIPDFLRQLAAIALERGCGRPEWRCPDRNRSSIGFCRSPGAPPMDEWTV